MKPFLTRRTAAWSLGATGTAVALIGVLHLPIARPLLATLGALCPVNNVSPSLVEHMQGVAVAALRGSVPAPSHDTIGLRLLSFTAREVDDWTRTRSLTCETTTRGFTYVSCAEVPAEALERDDAGDVVHREVVIARDSAGRTVGVDLLARVSPSRAAALAQAVARDLRATFGSDGQQDGAFDGAYLDAPFRSASLRYRFSDRVVVLSVTNVPGTGAVLREQYLSADAGEMAAVGHAEVRPASFSVPGDDRSAR